MTVERYAVSVQSIDFRYGEKTALSNVSLEVEPGEIFAVLGPNGGGKTTLFRLLSTAVAPQTGSIQIFGAELPGATALARAQIGVVFQKPSLDGKLTVAENLRHHGWLYGLAGQRLNAGIQTGLDKLGLGDRVNERAETLSGGLQRRVELAKALMTRPKLLILDEPSTGLDPGARHDLWRYLVRLREEDGTTVLLTTHLMDEAERADRIAILDKGRVVALDTPAALRSRIGGEILTIRTREPSRIADRIAGIAGARPTVNGETLRIESTRGPELVAKLLGSAADEIDSLEIAKPTLEDVFVRETGHRFWNEE